LDIGVTQGGKSPCSVVDTPPYSVEVKNEWIYTFAPLYLFRGWTGTTLLETIKSYNLKL
jgi:hypothetical protein